MISNIQIEDYSDKSFVVRGDTRDFRNKLVEMGGKWNSRLTDKKTSEKFGAWLFWTEKRPKVQKWFDDGCITQQSNTMVASQPVKCNKDHITILTLKVDKLTEMVTKLCDHFDIDCSKAFVSLGNDCNDGDGDDDDDVSRIPHKRLLTK